jgi:hypothetical protein
MVSKKSPEDGITIAVSKSNPSQRNIVLSLYDLNCPEDQTLQHLVWNDQAGNMIERDVTRKQFEEILHRILKNSTLATSVVQDWLNIQAEDDSIAASNIEMPHFSDLLNAIDNEDRGYASIVSAYLNTKIASHVVYAIGLQAAKRLYPNLKIVTERAK